MNTLVINSGSSSIKYQLIKMPEEKLLCSGLVERIALNDSIITHKVFEGSDVHQHKETGNISNHEEGLNKICDLLINFQYPVINNRDDISIVGHRVVHGGDTFRETTLITQAVKDKIKELFSLAPLHNPSNLLGIEVSEKLFKKAQQLAVFDTAFHQSIPEYIYRYALPEEIYIKNKVRVYGFHGISHQYVSRKAAEFLKLKNYKFVTLHLGNGCSAAAIKNGKSMDTSMGMGPLGGLVMGTRSGDVDPSALMYMVEQLGYSHNEIENMLNKNSGMKALTAFSDMREISKLYSEGNENAILAYNMASNRIKRYIGAYSAEMGGLDALIFTGGIGENDVLMRELVCTNLGCLGINIDKGSNNERSSFVKNISSHQCKGIDVLVVPTNEELEIAIQSYKCLNERA